jgi:hypothetical protein
MVDYNKHGKWYHGSSFKLDQIKKGSTITQNRDVARIFSHKPEIVSIDDKWRILHNGVQPGFLYEVAEPITTTDAIPHPRTTMQPGLEWLITRSLKVRLLCGTTPHPEEQLSEGQIVHFKAIHKKQTQDNSS